YDGEERAAPGNTPGGRSRIGRGQSLSRKKSHRGLSPPPYRDRSVTPASVRTSASTKHRPVVSFAGRERISTAASAMISGLREAASSASPSGVLATAEVAM